jgi:site-specific DNA-methyltransferase (adenine-specific)
MTTYYKTDKATVLHGNCLDVLKTLDDNSIDSVVTDPPYDLTSGGSKGGFMGNTWDATGIAFSPEVWKECLRVLKPGGHLISFGGTRTWHRMAVAVEDAGFELRDNIMWIYGKAFPKSHNISKAIAKTEGNEDEAKTWEGWGTALKPCVEPIVLARKPLTGTLAANTLEWGVGGLNIDGSRIETREGENFDNVKGIPITKLSTRRDGETEAEWRARVSESPEQQEALEKLKTLGRWPANVVLDEFTAPMVDEQSGFSKSPGIINRFVGGAKPWGDAVGAEYESVSTGVKDEGGASRFFYVAKASAKDRSEGLDGFKNEHPTVKPTKLMTYLVKLVTPEGGTVLDPFTGSGSTGKAALLEGFKFVGIEMTDEYLPIIAARLAYAEGKNNEIQR